MAQCEIAKAPRDIALISAAQRLCPTSARGARRAATPRCGPVTEAPARQRRTVGSVLQLGARHSPQERRRGRSAPGSRPASAPVLIRVASCAPAGARIPLSAQCGPVLRIGTKANN